MYAATVDSCMEYIVWEGINAHYPDSYYRFVQDHILEDEFRYSHFVTGEGIVIELVESVAVFLINKRKEVKLVEIQDLDEMGVRLTDRYFAMKEDCFLYYIHRGNYGVVPDWFMKQVEYGVVARYEGTWTFFDERGDIQMSPSCVFIWNGRSEELKYLETSDFKEMCIYRRY